MPESWRSLTGVTHRKCCWSVTQGTGGWARLAGGNQDPLCAAYFCPKWVDKCRTADCSPHSALYSSQSSVFSMLRKKTEAFQSCIQTSQKSQNRLLHYIGTIYRSLWLLLLICKFSCSYNLCAYQFKTFSLYFVFDRVLFCHSFCNDWVDQLLYIQIDAGFRNKVVPANSEILCIFTN